MLPNLSILDDFDRQGNAIAYSDSEVEESDGVPSNEEEDTVQSEAAVEESSVEVYIKKK